MRWLWLIGLFLAFWMLWYGALLLAGNTMLLAAILAVFGTAGQCWLMWWAWRRRKVPSTIITPTGPVPIHVSRDWQPPDPENRGFGGG